MVISEMNHNPYRFFLTQKFKGSYEMFISEFAIFVGVFLPKPWGPGGVILEWVFFGREIEKRNIFFHSFYAQGSPKSTKLCSLVVSFTWITLKTSHFVWSTGLPGIWLIACLFSILYLFQKKEIFMLTILKFKIDSKSSHVWKDRYII